MYIMYFVMATISTLFLLIWCGLLFTIQLSDWQASAYYKIVINQKKIVELKAKQSKNQEILRNYDGIAYSVLSLFLQSDYSKEIKKRKTNSIQMRKGYLNKVSLFPTCGHVMLRQCPQVRSSSIYRKMLLQFVELHGKKHATRLCDHLFACCFSIFFLGFGVILALGTGICGQGDLQTGGLVLVVGSALISVLLYALFDEVADQVNKRRETLLRQFPNVVSKLALLVTSGMVMDRAWKETAFSKNEELYQEMQLTSSELDNLMHPEEAYGRFIQRCHTKETSKLASALLQNLSKGNSEMGAVLREMAADAWQERRHLAKRDSENANAKMMIPTMLLFVTILMLILVPIAMNFSSL